VGSIFILKLDAEKVSAVFLEIASEQRLNILNQLAQEKLNISKLAKLLDATNPEVHRNIGRLLKNGLISKTNDGNYQLTTYGRIMLLQIPSISFVSENKDFFNDHDLNNVETKFLQRIGALESKKEIKGFVKVLEKWTKIQENADKFIYNILSEIPYSKDIIDIIAKKLEKKIPIKSIFPDSVVVPEDRKKIFEERGFQKYVSDGILQRRISPTTSVGLLITDKEAGVFFPSHDGEIDLSRMFYSSDKKFIDWCMDYFENSWKNATSFQETKLKK
jgi:predicted transcriptional regulator